jgi:AraC-like DNA-binding protein
MDRRVRKVVQVLNQSWSTPLRVSDLARRVGLGTSRLEHLFKEQARISIRDFIHERRLSAAAALLMTTEERVSVISFQVGFSHVANFNHAFKLRYGVTPREYRERRVESEKAETTK